jgi:hypothetical protein
MLRCMGPLWVDLSRWLQARCSDRFRLKSSPSDSQKNGVATGAERPIAEIQLLRFVFDLLVSCQIRALVHIERLNSLPR